MSPWNRRFAAIVVANAFLLVLLATSAHAAPGIGVAWTHCQGEAGAVQNRVFACDTNAGTEFAYGTFTLAEPFVQLEGTDAELQLVAASAVLPAWWQYGPMGCRLGSLTGAPQPDPEATLCEDWTQGTGNGNLQYCTPSASCGDPSKPPNTARIPIGVFVTPDLAQDLVANQPYFAFSIRMNHAKTVGTGACGGCETPVCITFTSFRLAAFAEPALYITTPSIPGGNVITWRGGVPGVPMCFAATPTRQSTWGSVKSLYR